VSVLVAVVDPLPLFRDGAVAALTAAGHTVQTPGDVTAWAREARDAVVLLTVESEMDWTVLERLAGLCFGTNALVVLLAEATATAGVRAVRMGARSVLGRGSTAGVLRRTITATIEGQAVLPAHVAAALAASVGGAGADPAQVPSAQQLSWLRALAEGSTVARLADRAGYSERAMFRLLRSLYRDLGAENRVQALMNAHERGWL
jgi:DNA-binding NarL/FixJ family response regulator